jgi:predicted XRE-type DNA-binding protein
VANEDLKNVIKESRIRQWEIAQKLGMADSNFSKLLRTELSNEKKTEILKVIEDLKC